MGEGKRGGRRKGGQWRKIYSSIKNNMRYHLTPVRMTKIKTPLIAYTRDDVE